MMMNLAMGTAPTSRKATTAQARATRSPIKKVGLDRVIGRIKQPTPSAMNEYP